MAKRNKSKALVDNAADEKQVKRAEKYQQEYENVYDGSLMKVMQTKEGRRVAWEILAKCKVFEEIWRTSAEIHFLAGKRSVGLEIMADLTRIDEDLFLTMQKENMKIKQEILNNVRSEQ